jgi:hypothetical protein
VVGHSQAFISSVLGITRRQVGYSIAAEQVTPKKRSGRPPKLTDAQVDELVHYVRQTRVSRQMSYLALAVGPFQHWNVTQYSIRHALCGRGYTRRIALAKPPLSEQNKRIRLAWATEHVSWTLEQWWNILWSDETWVTGGRHRRTWVTRLPGEELDETCTVDKVRKKRGWMFWACFSGTSRVPAYSGRRSGNLLTRRATVRGLIIPLVDGWLRLNPHLQFMQDGAPGHSAAFTIDELLAGLRLSSGQPSHQI